MPEEIQRVTEEKFLKKVLKASKNPDNVVTLCFRRSGSGTTHTVSTDTTFAEYLDGLTCEKVLYIRQSPDPKKLFERLRTEGYGGNFGSWPPGGVPGFAYLKINKKKINKLSVPPMYFGTNRASVSQTDHSQFPNLLKAVELSRDSYDSNDYPLQKALQFSLSKTPKIQVHKKGKKRRQHVRGQYEFKPLALKQLKCEAGKCELSYLGFRGTTGVDSSEDITAFETFIQNKKTNLMKISGDKLNYNTCFFFFSRNLKDATLKVIACRHDDKAAEYQDPEHIKDGAHGWIYLLKKKNRKTKTAKKRKKHPSKSTQEKKRSKTLK